MHHITKAPCILPKPRKLASIIYSAAWTIHFQSMMKEKPTNTLRNTFRWVFFHHTSLFIIASSSLWHNRAYFMYCLVTLYK
jgi:hypothetical protein